MLTKINQQHASHSEINHNFKSLSCISYLKRPNEGLIWY